MPHDGRVLMLGYMDREALARRWKRGEVHLLVALAAAAVAQGRELGPRADAGLDRRRLRPRRPAGARRCRAGRPAISARASCFDGERRPRIRGSIELEALIDAARTRDPESSYIARLLAAPAARARAEGRRGRRRDGAGCGFGGHGDALRGEAADLLFHLLVLLRGGGLRFADVVGELARRHCENRSQTD